MMKQTHKTAVLYFSVKQHTKKAAEKLAKLTNADTIELVPVTPYTADDVYYQNPSCRANQEQENNATRVAFHPIDIADYQTIFLGFPIWWYSAPKIIWTLLESVEFTGKTLIPFCTSGGSGIEKSQRELMPLNPQAHWAKGFRIDMSDSDKQIQQKLNQAIAT